MFQPLTWSGRPARWLYFTAILELVLAGVFAVVGYLDPTLRGGFYLTAAILGGLGSLLFLWARHMLAGYEEAQRLKVQGIPGTARIVGLRQTGMYLNEQPPGGADARGHQQHAGSLSGRGQGVGAADHARAAHQRGPAPGEGRPRQPQQPGDRMGLQHGRRAQRTGIPPDRIDRLEPGDTVPTRIDPANPAVMTVDWDNA